MLPSGVTLLYHCSAVQQQLQHLQGASSGPVVKCVLCCAVLSFPAGNQGFGMDPSVLEAIAEEVARARSHGIQIAVVVGGGNYFRGASAWAGLERATADYVGMLATVMNALCLQVSSTGSSCGCSVISTGMCVLWLLCRGQHSTGSVVPL